MNPEITHTLSTPPTFSDSIVELQSVLTSCRHLTDCVAAAGDAIVSGLRNGNKLLTCGNGGSAADALHLSEELVGRYRVDRAPLPAICLNSDVTALTCIANDYGYDEVFARQVRALGKAGDILVGFTTSGNSPNVLAAFLRAKALGLETILLSGKDGGKSKGTCDHEIIIPSQNTARIQEIHTLILHQWLEAIDAEAW
jgi:D-sedoheptulose 7-phosphate isomerase